MAVRAVAHRLAVLVTMIILIAAAVAVFWQHSGRAVWYDEAWVVEFAMRDSARGALHDTLARKQPAAAGYIVLMHAIDGVGQRFPWVYRLPSLLAGVGMLLGLGWLAGRWARHTAVGMCAATALLLCPFVPRYMTEIKQYMPAAALTVGLICATTWWLETRRHTAALAWLALALLAIVMTFAGWFAVAGTGALLFAVWCWKRRKLQVLLTVAMGVVVLAVAASLHMGFNRHLAGSDGLHDFWQNYFLPLDATLPAAAWSLGNDLLGQAWASYPSLYDVLLPASMVGFACWVWRDRGAAAAVLAVFAVTLAANLAGKWPLGHRLNLPLIMLGSAAVFAAPLALVGWYLHRRGRHLDLPRRSLRVTPFWLSALTVTATLALAGLAIHESRSADHSPADLHALLAELDTRSQRGDLVVLDGAVTINQQLFGPELAADRLNHRWPLPEMVDDTLINSIEARPRRRIFFASGHHNPDMAAQWTEIGKALEPYGRWERVWSGRMVALFELVRTEDAR